MAMTLRLDPGLEAELRLAAEEDRHSIHQTAVLVLDIRHRSIAYRRR